MTDSLIYFTQSVNVAPQSDAEAILKALIETIEAFGIENFAFSLCEPRESVMDKLVA